MIVTMPEEDRQALEALFRYLFTEGDFSYTLFGDKPMALLDFYVDLKLEYFNPSTLNTFAMIYKGWNIWQKYKSSFPTNSFVFNDYVKPDFEMIGFVLYHKPKVKAIYDKHKFLMDSVFKDIDHIATVLCPPKEGICSASGNYAYHQALGLLLGYNQTNAERFQERAELINALKMAPFALDGLDDQFAECILLSRSTDMKIQSAYQDFSRSKITDIIQRLNHYSRRLKPLRLGLRESSLSLIRTSRIMAFEGEEELMAIQEDYDKIRERLIEIYFSENFLEQILTHLQS